MDLSTAHWHKSKFSGDTGGHCVEVASNLAGVVAVRDSKRPAATVLVTSPAGWSQFLDDLKVGCFIFTRKIAGRVGRRDATG
ncbi:DUF397 domain-containing protein [Sphaerisporangium aureirubrum]|uniref:DUF397 domain-containing protein n=2 Tax=Sphaerisporangium aureirubrum TaxID=1544736 RepID=A0ABW1NPL1_9ACTN